jgi:hypothetical protein
MSPLVALRDMLRRRAASVANEEEPTWKWLAKATITTRLTKNRHAWLKRFAAQTKPMPPFRQSRFPVLMT